jgi:hypothetical protein
MFYVINKEKLWETRCFDSALSVAAHMLGRQVSNYLVIKSDSQGDRVVPFPSADVAEIQQKLEIA